MATWFSHPVDWQASMTLRTQSDNSMSVTIDKGPIGIKAFFDGFVVFRISGRIEGEYVETLQESMEKEKTTRGCRLARISVSKGVDRYTRPVA